MYIKFDSEITFRDVILAVETDEFNQDSSIFLLSSFEVYGKLVGGDNLWRIDQSE